MPISAACPSCGGVWPVPDDLRGESLFCMRCGTPFIAKGQPPQSLTLTVICPSCGSSLRAPREKLGRKGRCPHCRHSFPVSGWQQINQRWYLLNADGEIVLHTSGEVRTAPAREDAVLSSLRPLPADLAAPLPATPQSAGVQAQASPRPLGTSAPPQWIAVSHAEKKLINPWAQAGIGLGVVSLPLYWVGVVPIAAIVVCVVALFKHDERTQEVQWLAKVGLGLGIACLILSLIHYGHLR